MRYPGIFCVIGSLAGGRTSDFLRKRAVLKSGNEKLPPERRISSQIYGFVLSTAGICMYGWFCRFGIHVSAVLVSSAIGKHQRLNNPASFPAHYFSISWSSVALTRAGTRSKFWNDLGFRHKHQLPDRVLSHPGSQSGSSCRPAPQCSSGYHGRHNQPPGRLDGVWLVLHWTGSVGLAGHSRGVPDHEVRSRLSKSIGRHEE